MIQTKTSNDQTQLHYQWTNRFTQKWVTQYTDLLSELERYIPNHEAFLDIVEIAKLYDDLETGRQMGKKNVVTATTYLVVRDHYPWFSAVELVDGTDVSPGKMAETLWRVDKHAFISDIQSPEDCLDRMEPKLTSDQMEQTRMVLAEIPDTVAENKSNSAVVGAAMHFGFGMDLDDDTIREYLGDVLVGEVREVVRLAKDGNVALG